jgi:adenylylsulfate kinase
VGGFRVILVTGTVGVGKTSVLVEIGDLLATRDEAYALVDLDWLAWLRPDPGRGTTVQDVLVENLRHVAATFRDAGVERLALARAVRRGDELDVIRQAVGASEFSVVRLVASPGAIERRLRGRDSGAQLAEHLEEATAFAADAEEAGIGDAVVSTDDVDAAASARAVLERAGWI